MASVGSSNEPRHVTNEALSPGKVVGGVFRVAVREADIQIRHSTHTAHHVGTERLISFITTLALKKHLWYE